MKSGWSPPHPRVGDQRMNPSVASAADDVHRRLSGGDPRRVGPWSVGAAAGQTRTAASNGPDSGASLGLFDSSIPFDAPGKQADPRVHG